MIAEKGENLREASESLFILNADDITRQKCRAQKNETLTQKNDVLSQENEALRKFIEANNLTYNENP